MKAFQMTYNRPGFFSQRNKIVPAVDVVSAANKLCRKLKISRREITEIKQVASVLNA